MPGKMLETAEQAGALKAAHVNGRVTENFARRAPEGSRIETVRQQVAILGHDRHHGREVDVEAEHAQHFAGDPAERSCGSEVAVLANRARGGHRREYPAQAIDQSTFLIDTEQRWYVNDFSDAVEQRAQLFRTGDVATEDDHAAGLDFFDQGACFGVELGARKADE